MMMSVPFSYLETKNYFDRKDVVMLSANAKTAGSLKNGLLHSRQARSAKR